MKVLLIGSNGQLGNDLLVTLQNHQKEVVGLTHQEIEVTDPESIRKNLEVHKPDLVINTAAYHKVDEVETNPERAYAVNAIAPWRLASACHQAGITFMFISTDYVFGGDLQRCEPYDENDLPSPINVYGASKLAGEAMVRYACPQHYIVRSSGLYGLKGASGKGGNFVETMLRLANEGKSIKVVNDQRLTPTFTVDLAKAINDLSETGAYGLYHITSSGDCTWYEFALRIFELARISPQIQPVLSSEFKTTAQRPTYSVLSKQKLSTVGLPPMRTWREAIADYLLQRKK